MNRSCATIRLAIVIGIVICPSLLLGRQVVSPSTTGPLPVDPDDRVASELKPESTPDAEPSVKILRALQPMLPFDIEGSGAEESLLTAIRKFLTGQGEESLTMLDELRESRPDLPPRELLIAGVLFATGDTTLGRRWLEKTVAENPEYPAAWTGFARLAISEQRIADADALLEKADRLMRAGSWTDGQSKLFRSEYLDGLIDITVARGQMEDAKKYLLELRTLAPENPKIPLRLGQVEFDLGNVDSSLEFLREARNKAPAIRVPEVIISEWYMRGQKPEESEKWMSLAAERNPDNVDVMIDYARWLLQSERLPEALTAIDAAQEKGADEYLSRFIKGQIAFARRNYDLAEMHFDGLTRQKPGDADATNMLALSLIENPDDNRRQRALELAVVNQRMYPRSPTAAATVGWIYHRLGRQAEAQNVFRQVTSAKSMDPATAFFVASFLAERQDFSAAQKLLERALQSKNYFMFRNAAAELLKKVRKHNDANEMVPDDATSNNPDEGKEDG